MHQLMLFPDLTIPSDAADRAPRHPHICKPWRVAVRVLLALQQRVITAPLRRLDRDVDTEFDHPTKRVVSAAAAPPLTTSAAPSIFELAAAFKGLRARGRFGEAAGFEVPRYGVTVREGDVTRHIARRADETEEWAEKERARRARQKPPRPPRQQFKLKKSRTFGDRKP